MWCCHLLVSASVHYVCSTYYICTNAYMWNVRLHVCLEKKCNFLMYLNENMCVCVWAYVCTIIYVWVCNFLLPIHVGQSYDNRVFILLALLLEQDLFRTRFCQCICWHNKVVLSIPQFFETFINYLSHN